MPFVCLFQINRKRRVSRHIDNPLTYAWSDFHDYDASNNVGHQWILGICSSPFRPISNSAERSIYVRASLSTGLQSHCACREPSGDFLSRARPTIHCIVGTFTVLSVVEIRCFSFATLEPLAPPPPPRYRHGVLVQPPARGCCRVWIPRRRRKKELKQAPAAKACTEENKNNPSG